ncbi:hypothetical protein EVA_08066 [gut metagenome]|uniref:Uncharacterized protein n=1 Tax=gut metagenome TaxID=749906 RepID=J9GAF9_9ZZZZ
MLAIVKTGWILSALRLTKIITRQRKHELNRNKHKSGFLISWSRKNGKRKQRFSRNEGRKHNAETKASRSYGSTRANDAFFVGGNAKRKISRIALALSHSERREQTQGRSGTASGGGCKSGRSRSMLARRARAVSRALHRA